MAERISVGWTFHDMPAGDFIVRRIQNGCALSVESRKQFRQALRECWVAYNAISQCGVRQIAHHCHLDDGHDFSAFDAENGRPKNLIGPPHVRF
jgi:hypothetical protein